LSNSRPSFARLEPKVPRERMDYDQSEIPAAYDLGRDHGPAVTALWMAEISRRVADRPIRTILDLGCGTGRFSNALATRFHARLIGIDPSSKMLAQARSKVPSNGVSYACVQHR
jgi:ubiquinone/menaquinone biosynthesis C-methylase UbiE